MNVERLTADHVPEDVSGVEARVLVVGDRGPTWESVASVLRGHGFRLEDVPSADGLVHRTDLGCFAFLVLDERLLDGNAADILPGIRMRAPRTRIVLLVDPDRQDEAVDAMRHGADDYLVRPLQAEALAFRLQRLRDVQRMGTQLREAQRLAVIGRTVSAVSHEVRNELHVLDLGIDLVSRDVTDRPAVANRLEHLRTSEHRLRRLFEDLKRFAGPLQLERSPQSLPEVWRSAWSSLEDEWTDRDVLLREVIDDEGAQPPVDAFRMEQVFRNLFENSLSICHDPVRLEARCEVDRSGAPDRLRVRIRDNGPGLDQAERENLFRAFYTTRSNGTGLGLTICQRIVEAHDGVICAGDGGEGAEFVITLPLVATPVADGGHGPFESTTVSLVPNPGRQ